MSSPNVPGGALRDDSKNGCVTDYGITGLRENLGRDHGIVETLNNKSSHASN